MSLLCQKNIIMITKQCYRDPLDLVHRIIMDLIQNNVHFSQSIISRLQAEHNIDIGQVFVLIKYYRAKSKQLKSSNHSCQYCNYYFASIKNKEIHESLPHGYAFKHCPLRFTHQFSRLKHVNVKHKKTQTCPKCLIVKACSRNMWKNHVAAAHKIPCMYWPECKLMFARNRDLEFHLKNNCDACNGEAISAQYLANNNNEMLFEEEGPMEVDQKEEAQFEQQVSLFIDNIFEVIKNNTMYDIDLTAAEYDVNGVKYKLLKLAEIGFVANNGWLQIPDIVERLEPLTLPELRLFFVACSINCKESVYHFYDGIQELNYDEAYDEMMTKEDTNQFTLLEEFEDILSRRFTGNWKETDQPAISYPSTFHLYPNIMLSSTAEIFSSVDVLRCKTTFNMRYHNKNFIEIQYVDQGRIMMLRIYPYWIENAKLIKFIDNKIMVQLQCYQYICFTEIHPMYDNRQYKASDVFSRIPFENNKHKVKSNTVTLIWNKQD
eukprot:880634_1